MKRSILFFVIMSRELGAALRGIPSLTADAIEAAIPGVTIDGPARDGGQKRVFPCVIDGTRWAIKFVLLPDAEESDEELIDDSGFLRLKREVATMEAADSPHLVKLGPLPLTLAVIADRQVAYYTEEWVEGEDLFAILVREQVLCVAGLCRLGHDVSLAIDGLWAQRKIHRDIKPGNIMRRTDSREFVLLDVGLCLDQDDKSITQHGALPGTRGYWAPEQFDLRNKRNLDLRCDLFVLGLVMYECAVGQFPFDRHQQIDDLIRAISEDCPDLPSAVRPELPTALDAIVLRLLAKQPFQRFRSGALLREALRLVPQE